MGGLFGAPKVPAPPAPEPPPPMPVDDDTAARAAKRREQEKSQNRRGARSTLLSQATAPRSIASGSDTYSSNKLG